MFAYFTGFVQAIHQDYIILLVNDIGYKIHIAPSFKMAIAPQQKLAIHAETIVREDSITIFGFRSDSEKHLFLTLISVQGVGAKMAMAMLGALSDADISLAIAAGDVTMLCRAPGVGKKLAARIIQELQDSIGNLAMHNTPSISPSTANTSQPSITQDLVAALVSLGYQQSDSYKISLQLCQANPDKTIEHLIPLALQQLSS